MKQLLDYGIDQDKIYIPPKSLLGSHPFAQQSNRVEAASILHRIMNTLDKNWKIVSVGGTALGFNRDNDFIKWDFDIDLFAPYNSKSKLFDLLNDLGFFPEFEDDSIKATIILNNGIKIPFAVDFYDTDMNVYLDEYEDYVWEWPIEMFTKCSEIEIHGRLLNIPNPSNFYLTEVYGSDWNVPNPEFGYSDYYGKKL